MATKKRTLKSVTRTAVRKILAFKIIPSKLAIKASYFLAFKRRINLKNPKTFNEKLNWIKLYYRKPVFTTMVDKYEVKQYVSSIIGEQYIIPTIGIYNRWKDIDFSKLKAPYVIKTTNSSGVVFVIREGEKPDFNQIKKKINKSLKTNYYYHCREWPYKNVKPRILIEQFVSDSIEKNLPVFKFFCFNSEPYLVQTIKNDKTSYETIDYFDMDWQKLDLKQNFNNSEIPLPKPSNFEAMKEIAKVLSKDLPFIRIDLYSVNGNIYFSEFTFFSDAGFTKFYPEKWDRILGDKIDLNGIK